MEERRKLLDDDHELQLIEGKAIRHRSGPVVGANARRDQIAFIPRSGNKAFNGGEGLSIEYHYLVKISFLLDYSRLTIIFSDCRVILEGPNLKPLYDRIRIHHEDLVEEADPMHAMHDPLGCSVTCLMLEPLKEGS
ncbi:hypothetical protein AB1L88_25930 [Tautonia sp. JC769]|uniref:hypothetical protein n=1 Tax=Tautonia sp. JC769 TaxID=3232135 RepID=UPI0034577284